MSKDRCWAQWAALYDHFPNLGHPPPTSEREKATLFAAYVGGIYLQDSLKPIQSWIAGLIKLDEPVGDAAVPGFPVPQETTQVLGKRDNDEGGLEETPPMKRKRTTPPADTEVEAVPTGIQTDPIPPLPTELHATTSAAPLSIPQIESTSPTPPPPVDLKGKKWISILNEGCAKGKRGASPVWRLDQTGQANNPQWSAALDRKSSIPFTRPSAEFSDYSSYRFERLDSRDFPYQTGCKGGSCTSGLPTVGMANLAIGLYGR